MTHTETRAQYQARKEAEAWWASRNPTTIPCPVAPGQKEGTGELDSAPAESSRLGLSSTQICTRYGCHVQTGAKAASYSCRAQAAVMEDADRLASLDRELDVTEQIHRDANANIVFHPEGTLLKVENLKGWHWGEGKPTRGDRRACYGFSPRSRKALLELMGMLKRMCRPLFVTLTLPARLQPDPQQAKEWLRCWCQRMERRFAEFSAIWKMEPQENGTPHFHLFVWGMEFLPWYEVAVSWAEVVASCVAPKLPHLTCGPAGANRFRLWLSELVERDLVVSLFADVANSGTRVEAIESDRGVKAYAAKYVAKVVNSPQIDGKNWEKPGRFWGIRRRERLPRSRKSVACVDRVTGVKFARLLRRYMNSQTRLWCSLGRRKRLVVRKVCRSLHSEHALQWARALVFCEGFKDGTGPTHDWIGGKGALAP